MGSEKFGCNDLDKIITPQTKVFEFFTASGNRVVVKGSNILTNFQAGDISVYDNLGEVVAQFEIMNLEGWRIAQ